MTDPTLRELCERVIDRWNAHPSTWTDNTFRDACYTLGKRLHIDASMWNDLTAKTILAALDAEREAGRARGFVDAMSEMSFGSRELPPQPLDRVQQPAGHADREHGGSEREKV